MHTTDINELNGKIVLVRSAKDTHNPPTGLRGTVRVAAGSAGERPRVEVELDFPQMFLTRAHQRFVTLTEEQIVELLASEHYGAFSVTLDGVLDPASPVE